MIGNKSVSTVRRMIDKISHRGPDGIKIWASNEGEHPVALAHARLSIIDLSEKADQPFVSDDGQHVMVYNGEIYNYIELREELISRGLVFRTDSDTEVLLNGLLIDGIKFFHKCNGMWALCLYNRKTKKAILARDRFGIKPLYYTSINNNSLAFASEMKSLTILQDSVKQNPAIRIGQDIFNYECTDQTVFRDIYRLQPGVIAQFVDGRLHCERWWSTLDNLEEVGSNYQSQVDKWKSIFFDSVKIRMRSDVALGTALSGGLDSSSVASVMHSLSTENILPSSQTSFKNAICSHYPGSSLDEVRWASIVAQSCGMQFSKHQILHKDTGWGIENSLYQTEEPYLTYALPMLSTYKKFKKSGISVTLDGHGSDEMLSGYGHIRQCLRSTRDLSKMREILRMHNSTVTGIYSEKEKIRKRDLAFEYARSLFSGAKANFSNSLTRRKNVEHIQSLSQYNCLIEATRNDRRFKRMDPFTKILYELFHFTVLPTLLRNYDRYSMASGVESRMPFMDWRLVAYTFSLPWESKLGGGFTKRIQRDALHGVLVDSVRLRRDKIGWNAPLHDWLQNELRDEVDYIFSFYAKKNCFRSNLSMWNEFLSSSCPTFQYANKVWAEAILPVAWEYCIEKDSFA